MLRISDIERSLSELPLLPTIVTRLLILSPNDDEYFEKVLDLAKQDPSFAIRITSLSNSAASYPASPITSLEAAVVRVGAKQIAGLVTSLAVTRVFFPATTGEKNLWIHAVQVAVAAREIAKSSSDMEVDPDQAYLCGLLHDIGRFVLFEKAAHEQSAVDEHQWTSPAQLVEIERKSYGFDHAELGWKVCKHWGIPDLIAMVVKLHHEREFCEKLARDVKLARLINVVQIADFFSVFMMLTPDFLSMKPAELENVLHEKCILASCLDSPVSARALMALAERILQESNETISNLGIIPEG